MSAIFLIIQNNISVDMKFDLQWVQTIKLRNHWNWKSNIKVMSKNNITSPNIPRTDLKVHLHQNDGVSSSY